MSGVASWTPPGGSSGQIQYNNAGVFGGASYKIDASGNLVAPYASANTTPPADSLSFAPQRLLASGGRVIPRWLSEEGVFMSLQPHIGRNSVMFSHGQGTAATPTIIGGVLTNVGTLTARPPASTNRATRSKRTGYVSAATAGATAGAYAANTNSTYFSLGTGTNIGGGGFFAVFRWVESDAATVAGAHMFLGLSSTVAAPTAATNPNTFTNSVGVAQTNGGANLKIVYGGSAAQTEIDLGANFPASGHSADEYEAIFYAPPNVNNTVFYRVERINTGDVATGTLTGTAGTVLPANTTFLGPRMFRSNNATALAVGLDIVSFYVESDFA
jgi:hypothetical protein